MQLVQCCKNVPALNKYSELDYTFYVKNYQE